MSVRAEVLGGGRRDGQDGPQESRGPVPKERTPSGELSWHGELGFAW